MKQMYFKLFVFTICSFVTGVNSKVFSQEVVHDTVFSFDANAEVIPSYHEVDTDCNIYLINGKTYYGNYAPITGWRFVPVSQKHNKTRWKAYSIIHHYHTIVKFKDMPKKGKKQSKNIVVR